MSIADTLFFVSEQLEECLPDSADAQTRLKARAELTKVHKVITALAISLTGNDPHNDPQRRAIFDAITALDTSPVEAALAKFYN